MIQHIAAVFLAIMFFANSSVAGLGQNRQVIIESKLIVMNPNTVETITALTPIEMSGTQLPAIVRNIPVNSSIVLDGSILGLQPGFSGSVIIQADQPVFGVIQNNFTNSLGNRGRSAYALRGTNGLDQTVYLPLVRNSNNVESFIAVQNTGSANTDLIIDCISASVSTQILTQSLLPGATSLVKPPNNFEGTAVITSSNTEIVVHAEILDLENGTSSSYTGIPDQETAVQTLQPFTYNSLDDLLTTLALMNVSMETADGVVGFTDDPNSGWDWEDYPDILSYRGVNIIPPASTTWNLGEALLSMFPKQASISLTSNDDKSISFATLSTPYPAPLLFKWYIPAVNDKTDINLSHDAAIPTDFKATWKFNGTNEITDTFSIGTYGRTTLVSPLPADTEGSVIIENLTAFPTGLAIEVKDKSGYGDYSVYAPANFASTILFAPWFTYQYGISSSTSLLYQIISIIAAGKENQPDQEALIEANPD